MRRRSVITMSTSTAITTSRTTMTRRTTAPPAPAIEARFVAFPQIGCNGTHNQSLKVINVLPLSQLLLLPLLLCLPFSNLPLFLLLLLLDPLLALFLSVFTHLPPPPPVILTLHLLPSDQPPGLDSVLGNGSLRLAFEIPGGALRWFDQSRAARDAELDLLNSQRIAKVVSSPDLGGLGGAKRVDPVLEPPA